MPNSLTLDTTIEHGFSLRSPQEGAKLGFFETEDGVENGENVFVFVVHYDFKGCAGDWPRPGNNKDVENLRETFGEKRSCRFREWSSPRKEDFLTLLANENKLKRYFASEDDAPSVFVLYVLSHGDEDGVIYTDTPYYLNQYETFNTKDVFDSLEHVFSKSLKFIFLGPCRGKVDDKVFNPNDGQLPNKNSCRVSFEPKARNLIILYSTVETTAAKRDDGGTWMVKFSCDQLNEMRKNESVTKFLTGVQNRIHTETTMFRNQGQTPELKMNSQDRKFTFSCLDKKILASSSRTGTDAKGTNPSVESVKFEESRSINFDWWNPISKTVLRGRRAVIFHQGSENNDQIKSLDCALIKNLGFETITAKLNEAGLNHYCNKLENACWDDYGCFAAFTFAEILEREDGDVCIRLDEIEIKSVGDFIHGLLGPKNDAWIGKPKLFFFY
ncbi:uncharacterized protein LOC132196058 isoform X2 [Neocloeon triangulifer]|uniref:uncharacterized protein LOC132196058 isoform X2 n=1 Tax=Neocloeon triangulifer TaxID=2078957 RepID=UPI00286F59C1|nr:uncharacterized protein LOC132196058 isoform X2 [Neocloeon triangulifer]